MNRQFAIRPGHIRGAGCGFFQELGIRAPRISSFLRRKNEASLHRFDFVGTAKSKNFGRSMIGFISWAIRYFWKIRTLKDAYELAEAAVQQVPNRLAWRKRLAQVAEWTGRPTVALKQWRAMAEQEPKSKHHLKKFCALLQPSTTMKTSFLHS